MVQIDDIEDILEEKMGLPLRNGVELDQREGRSRIREDVKEEGASGGSGEVKFEGFVSLVCGAPIERSTAPLCNTVSLRSTPQGG